MSISRVQMAFKNISKSHKAESERVTKRREERKHRKQDDQGLQNLRGAQNSHSSIKHCEVKDCRGAG